MATMSSPYYPAGVVIANYIPNEYATLSLILIFAGASITILTITYLTITRVLRPQISTGDLSTALWFMLCGFIHLFFEGFYSLNFQTMGSNMTIFGQLWKEYSLSDSRYLVPNSFVMSMETITAFFWGPLSFALVWMIVSDSPLRYPVQIIVSLGQLYGDVLYYATCTFEELVHGIVYSRPEGWYFWGYYVFLNAFWVVIPLGLVISGVSACGRSFQITRAMNKNINGGKKRN